MIGNAHIASQMERFYAFLIQGKCGRTISFNTKNVPGSWRFSSTGLFSTGWWLNVAHRVSAAGGFKYCCGKKLCKLTDVSVNWEWYDDIDAKDFIEALDEYERGAEGWGWLERRLASIGLTVEALWDIFGDKIADTDFRIRIKWEESREEPITIVRR